MAFLDVFRSDRSQVLRESERLGIEREQLDASLEFMQERLAELELALEDESWQRLGMEGERDFSPAGRMKIVRLARLMYLKNPLIRRAVNVQTYYVMGQGVEVSGRSEQVNDILQAWWNNPLNANVLTGHQGLTDRERDLQVDGELFFVSFANPSTGEVQTRTIHPEEITHIITNPEDDQEPWFYRRAWTRETITGTGSSIASQEVRLYPAMNYRPTVKPTKMDGVTVQWDQPVYHVMVGGLGGMKRGLPDFYSAMAFARSYHSFLEDWASITRSLSRWAWKYTAGKRQSVSRLKSRFGTTVSDTEQENNPAPSTGSVFIEPTDGTFAPIPKTGANVSAEDGRGLRTMVAAGVDIPDSILANDPQQGALATAKTLDRPTELAMSDRQQLWASVLRDLACYALERAVVAPNGVLKGTVTVAAGRIEIDLGLDPATGEPHDATIDVSFPPILDQDTLERVGAIVKAATLDGKVLAGTLVREEVSRQLMSALGVENIDQALDELFPTTTTTETAAVLATFRAELKEYLSAPNGAKH